MKNLFKLIIAAFMICFIAPGLHAKKVAMPVDQMPAQVKQMLQEHYPGVPVEDSWAGTDDISDRPTCYNVTLNNGIAIKFSGEGNWRSITTTDANAAPAPVSVLPEHARRYILQAYPNTPLKSIRHKGVQR